MRRTILAGLVASLLVAALAAPVAAKPKVPSGPPDNVYEFDAGVVCAFPVRLEDWTHDKVRETVNKQGHAQTIIVGTSRTRVSRLDLNPNTSVMVSAGGRVVLTDPDDGTQRLEAHGRTLFFFFPGDQNPAGEGNGLYLVRGHVKQTLDLGQDLITHFAYRGTYEDICARLS